MSTATPENPRAYILHIVSGDSRPQRGTTETIERRQPNTAAPATVPPVSTVDAVSSMVPTLVSAVPSPFANYAPTTPLEAPTQWTLLAFSRREFGQASSTESPTVNPLAGRVTNGLVTESPTLNGQSIDAASTGNVGAPTAALAGLTMNAQLDAATPATFTGEPSNLSKLLSAAFGFVGKVGTLLNADLSIPLTRLLSSDSPPRFTTLGLNVQRSEFEGMPVWTLQAPRSTSEEVVIAVHGGALVLEPTVFNWLFYGQMARDTGATVIVPMYPLVPQGTASTVVPVIADLISAQIDQHGVENVSVFGDSAGGNIALVAVQELVRRGDPVPSRLVLSSPGLDATLSNPAIQFVNDPVLPAEALRDVLGYTQLWAGDLALTDPLVSPLYGSLAGLPPTAVYAGGRDAVGPDVLLLQDKALATPGADFTFVLRAGEPHDWAILTILPETQAVLPDIYRQLGITA